MTRNNNTQWKNALADSQPSKIIMEGVTAEALNIKPRLEKDAPFNQTWKKIASLKSSSPDLIILTVCVSKDNIDSLNQCIDSLHWDYPLSLVVFSAPDLKPESLKDRIAVPEFCTISIISDKSQIAAQRICLVPADTYISLEKGTIRYIEQPDRNISPLEDFLSSIVLNEKSRSIVLLFTSWIAPYIEGLKSVREEQGLVFQINPTSHPLAEWDMPIHDLLVDAVLPAKNIADRVNGFIESTLDDQPARLSLEQEDIQSLENIYLALAMATGIRCSDFDLIFIMEHLQQRLVVHGRPGISAYTELIQNNEREARLLARRISLNVTGFFYEVPTMQMIVQDIIPELLENKESGFIRAWVPACSSGEEVLSLIILLNDYAANLSHPPGIQVIGTDSDEDILKSARRAEFIHNSLHTVPESFKDIYFEKDHDTFAFNRNLLQHAHFAQFDLINPPPYAGINLIYYRRHLGKLKKDVQQKVLKNLHASLAPGGYLVIGETDRIGSEIPFFSPADKNGRVYKPVQLQKKTSASTPVVSLFRTQDAQSPPESTEKKESGEMSQVEETRRLHQVKQLHKDLLLRDQKPVSVLLKSDFSILDQYGQITKYISWPKNGKTTNFLKAFPEAVRTEIRDAVRQAIKQQKALRSSIITPQYEGILNDFFLRVLPFEASEKHGPFVQVLFIEPETKRKEQETEPVFEGQPIRTIISKLETELNLANGKLIELTGQLAEARAGQSGRSNPATSQTMTEHMLEQQNRELHATNKELLSLNRDLVRRIEELRKRMQQAQPATPAPAEKLKAAEPVDPASFSKQVQVLTEKRNEIRMAITSIVGYANMLTERVHDAGNKELIKYISKAGNQLSDALTDLMDGNIEEMELSEHFEEEEERPQLQNSTHSAIRDQDYSTLQDQIYSTLRDNGNSTQHDQAYSTLQDHANQSERLLVVEDSDATRRLLSLVLRDRFECELAADASEAIEKAEKEQFKAVLMDINLGAGQSGVDVLEYLRQTDLYQRVPFMAVTAMASPKEENLLRQKGFDAYLAKPFQKARLLSALDQMLSEYGIA